MIENSLEIGGAVTFWTLSEHTNRDCLEQEFLALQLESFLPEPRPLSALLKDALEEVMSGSRLLIRPLADKEGFAVIREERGTHNNVYNTELLARVQQTQPPTLFIQPNDERATQLRLAFANQTNRLPATQMSNVLVRLVEHIGGVRLRPSGAVYWIPGPRLDEWQRIALATEVSAVHRPSAVYLLRHQLDASAIRAVREAVLNDVQAETQRICDEITSGQLGSRALETRQRQAGELRHKVLLYEDILNVTLDNLHAAVERTEQAAATASLLLASQVHTFAATTN